MKIDLTKKEFEIYLDFLNKFNLKLETSFYNDNVCVLYVTLGNYINIEYLKEEIKLMFDINDCDFSIEKIENSFLIIFEF